MKKKSFSLILFFAFFALSILYSLESHAVVVEKILAKIDGRIFTLSDFNIAKKFHLVEIVHKNIDKNNNDLYLQKLIDSELIYKEAMLLKIISITENEENSILAKIKENPNFDFQDSLKKFDISEKYLKNLIRKKIFAKKYYQLRKNFFQSFGEEEGLIKMNTWLERMRKKASLKIIGEIQN